MQEETVKCRICGEPYVVYPMYVGDQSACRKCRDKARMKTRTYQGVEQQDSWITNSINNPYIE